MGVHNELVELVAAAGSDVLRDADAFRAAIDDFLDSSDATSGEINLLVDAVRLGAVGRVVEQVAHGADPALVVAAVGDGLARDRGTVESAGARWAVAALGFASGVVPEDVVNVQAEARAATVTGEIQLPGRPVALTTVVRRDTGRVSTLPEEAGVPAAPAAASTAPRRGLLVAALVAAVVVLVGVGLGIRALTADDRATGATGATDGPTSAPPTTPVERSEGATQTKRDGGARSKQPKVDTAEVVVPPDGSTAPPATSDNPAGGSSPSAQPTGTTGTRGGGTASTPTNHAPRVTGVSASSTDENVTFSATVRGSDQDGDSWRVTAVSGAGLQRTGTHSIGGFISRDAATATTSRHSIAAVSRSVTVTVTDGRDTARFTFTLRIRDTHLAMPGYIGKYGNSPDIATLFVPNFAGCIDTSREESTIIRQSVAAGSTVAWGASPRFTYVHHDGSYPAC